MGYTIQNCACCQSDCCACGECEFSPDATVDYESKSVLCGYDNTDCTGEASVWMKAYARATGVPMTSCGVFSGPVQDNTNEEQVFASSCPELPSGPCTPGGETFCLTFNEEITLSYDCVNNRWNAQGSPITDGNGNYITGCNGGSLSWTSCTDQGTNGDKTTNEISIVVNGNDPCEGAPAP